jgi:hypothetical protein
MRTRVCDTTGQQEKQLQTLGTLFVTFGGKRLHQVATMRRRCRSAGKPRQRGNAQTPVELPTLASKYLPHLTFKNSSEKDSHFQNLTNPMLGSGL